MTRIASSTSKSVKTVHTRQRQEETVNVKFSYLQLDNQFLIVTSARKGLKPELAFDFADTIHMSDNDIAQLLNITYRTLLTYKDKKKKLEPVKSEHLLKLIALYKKGEEAFGNVEEFNAWLKKPYYSTNEPLITWLDTPGGVDLVSNELDKLMHGYVI